LVTKIKKAFIRRPWGDTNNILKQDSFSKDPFKRLVGFTELRKKIKK
jgi:hypothetical protein